jgi:hypothetical protein
MRHAWTIPILAVLVASSAQGAEKTVKAVPAPAAKDPQTIAEAPSIETEEVRLWKALRVQEQWVSKLKKQLAGESNQLTEMRASFAQAFKLDPKKLESGAYELDEKSGKIAEKK